MPTALRGHENLQEPIFTQSGEHGTQVHEFDERTKSAARAAFEPLALLAHSASEFSTICRM